MEKHEINRVVVYLEEVLDAFVLLRENMEDEGYHPQEIKPWEAVCFVQRFPLHLATLDVLLREMNRNVETLKEAVGE